MSAHRYWRLNMTANNGGTKLGFSRLHLRTDVYGSNLVPPSGQEHTHTFASSTEGGTGNIDPSRLIMYTSSDYRWNTDSVTTGWWKIDFGVGIEHAIWYYDMVFYSTWQAANITPKNWTLEYSDNDSDWTVVDTRTNQTGWVASTVRKYYVTKPWGINKPTNTYKSFSPLKVNGNIKIARTNI